VQVVHQHENEVMEIQLDDQVVVMVQECCQQAIVESGLMHVWHLEKRDNLKVQKQWSGFMEYTRWCLILPLII